MKKCALGILILLLLQVGCVKSTNSLRQISLGIDKQQVEERLGEPSVARGAILNKYGQTIEVWEYVLALPSDDSAGDVVAKSILTVGTLGMAAGTFKTKRENYWLYFNNGQLVQWGKAGDWKKEADRIYEIRFGSQNVLTNN